MQIDKNIAEIKGYISKEPEFSHEILGEGFYKSEIATMRDSEVWDLVPIIFSDRSVDLRSVVQDAPISAKGSVRTRNVPFEGRKKMEVFVFCNELEVGEFNKFENRVSIEGYTCKESVYRKTPLNREIADLLLAVNRSYGSSDYIPCIAWKRNARYVSELKVGTKLSCEGRFQSRRYRKEVDGNIEGRIAYEVSFSSVVEIENKGE